MLRRLLLLTLLTTATSSNAQWQLQDAHTTADLRGIDNVGGGVAWASGSDGTILRTEDAGFVWQLCAKPPGGEHLDFRAIQAFDNNTAIVMSSGKGDLSRLYKTTDGCQTWKLLFTNPDKDGFWDGLVINNHFSGGFVIGDPVNGKFAMFASMYRTDDWKRFSHTVRSPNLDVTPLHAKGETLFAASNSILSGDPGGQVTFVTGGQDGSFLHATGWRRSPIVSDWWHAKIAVVPVPLAKGATAGAFSFATREGCPDNNICGYVVVGGDYAKPDEQRGTAAYGTVSNGSEVPEKFTAATTPPHGYRSAVAYDSATKTWITVGPNGTDISTDDGRNWRALKPDAKFNDTPDADQHWNALSLPYVVGPHGRIGTLRPSDLHPKQ